MKKTNCLTEKILVNRKMYGSYNRVRGLYISACLLHFYVLYNIERIKVNLGFKNRWKSDYNTKHDLRKFLKIQPPVSGFYTSHFNGRKKMNIIQKDNIQFYFGLIEFKGEGIVKQRKGKAGTRKGKHVWAGKKIPAVVVGFCGVCNIPIREENEELLRFLKVPEIFEYVLTGVFEALAKRPSQ